MTTRGPNGTRKFGERVGRLVRCGDVIGLFGGLGTGKTCFVQGFAKGIGVREWIRSPSFIIINEYMGRFPLYHFDLYRIETMDELVELGYEEYLYGKSGVSIIEWAQKFEAILPREHLRVEFTWTGPMSRRIDLVPKGAHFKRMVKYLER